MSTIIKDLGAVSAYAYAVEKGYTGTEAEFAELMADYAEVGQRAEDAAESALNSKTAAQTAATTATNKASEATTAAQTATTKAGEAQTSAQTASSKASEASQSASTASQKATEASQSATNAGQSAQTAEQAKTASQTAQGLAESARNSAIQAKNDAESARDEAQDIVDGINAKASQIDANTASIASLTKDKAPVITDTASGSIASFTDGADGLPLKGLVVNIDPVQDTSSGDPSPENICPISGWDVIGVQTAGINLFDKSRAQSGYFLQDMSETGGESSNRYRSDYIKCTPGTPYYFANIVPSPATTRGVWYDRYKHPIRTVAISPNTSTSGADTAPENAAYLRAVCYKTDADIFMIAKGTIATDYHPYTGRSITIDLGQTVYGGKLDVLSGVLTINNGSFKVSDYTWTRGSTEGAYKFYCVPAGIKRGENINHNGSICSEYVGVPFNDFASTPYAFSDVANAYGRITVNDPNFYYSTAQEFMTAKADVRFVYPLATPIEIQLTPHEVNSLLGQNNIFADTGECSVEYRADTKLFIERLTAPDSADMIADANITSGQYFMVGNSLYKATANIANGSAIVVGTNCTRKSLSEALNEINA